MDPQMEVILLLIFLQLNYNPSKKTLTQKESQQHSPKHAVFCIEWF